MSWDTIEFRQKLDDQHTFPEEYIFKFIVPSDSVAKVVDLWSRGEIRKKPSSKGNYTSVTIIAQVDNSDQIVDIYQRASKIEGCIAL
ncbi:MAG: DUF493 domain-containing protein [Cytophagales bacterium]|nr:DUF493 domain-containing protein [Cytophagales bacterium]